MKRRNLEQHLRKHGCVLERESKHSIWKNPTFNVISAVPRHAEIPRGTVRAICRDLRFLVPSDIHHVIYFSADRQLRKSGKIGARD